MPKMLTVPEAAERLRLSTSTVYHLVSGRGIPFYKVGQKVLFAEPELEEWLAARQVRPIAARANEGRTPG